MIVWLAMLAVCPSEVRAATEPSGHEIGPRPNRDPEAVPDGRRPVGPSVTLTGSVSIVSDYRFRGITQTRGRPAVQVAVEVASKGGFYAGTFASNAAVTAGARAEVDFYGGYRVELSGWQLDSGLASYLYPGASSSSSAEVYGSVARDVAGVEVRTGASYAPATGAPQAASGLYLFIEGLVPVSTRSISLRAHLGRERGVNVAPGVTKTDWLLGLEHTRETITVSVAFVGGNDGRSAAIRVETGFVGSVTTAF